MPMLRPTPLLKLLPLLALVLGACEGGLPTAAPAPSAGSPRLDVAGGFNDFQVCSMGADGTYTVTVAGVLQAGTATVANGTCQVIYSYANQFHAPGQNVVTITRLAQTGIQGDSIVKDSTKHTASGPTLQTYTTLYGVDTVSSTVNNDAAASATFYLTVLPPPPPPPGTDCTYTIGFWKTHAGFGPQADVVTPLLPQWLGTANGAKSVDVTTAAEAVFLLSNSNKASNPVNRLYAQLLGAKLSIAGGADGSAIASVISAADAFLAQYDNTSTLTKAQTQQVNSWQSALDDYNNGLTGPGHCS